METEHSGKAYNSSRQEYHKFRVSLDYLVKPYLKTKKQNPKEDSLHPLQTSPGIFFCSQHLF